MRHTKIDRFAEWNKQLRQLKLAAMAGNHSGARELLLLADKGAYADQLGTEAIQSRRPGHA
jgi:hypothetical protein